MWKFYVIINWRSKMLGKSQAEVEKVKASPGFLNDHAAQLNEVEWTSALLPPLLFLAAKGEAAPVASTLAVAGSVLYMLLRLSKLAPVPAVLMRAVALGTLGVRVYTVAAR